MQPAFNPDYFILLDPSELEQLATAANRNEFQPALGSFLQATRNLRALRRLALEGKAHKWCPPNLILNANGEITDEASMIRGYRRAIPLPPRPGEAQMAFSYDWFWHEFCKFLACRQIWRNRTHTQLICISQQDPAGRLPDLWSNFWDKLAGKDHLDQSVSLFLDNKTLFKNQAKPWGSKDIPVLGREMAEYLIDYYRRGKSNRKHFKQGAIEKAVKELQDLIAKGNYPKIPFQFNQSESHLPGGDFNMQARHVRCSACGEIVDKRKSYKRLAVFLKDADERPQSGVDKDKRSRYCPRCVATVFLCPLKLAPETLTVHFASPVETPETLEAALKKYVAQTLNVNAGSYISLHITDVLDRKPLSQVWGAFHYALWKMAVTFPPELFAQRFTVEVFPGEERFTLPRWALWFVSALARWDNVFEYRAYRDRDLKTPFSQFLRLTSRKSIFQAFYTLFAHAVINDGYAATWKMNALQEIWSGLETILKEEDMPIPDYPMIAGYAGLLLPLAERVQFSKQKNEQKRAITKLLEEVDKPIQYAYTAARESGSSEFIFCRRPRNRYFFDKAVVLLEMVGEDVATLQKEAERIVNENEGFSWARDAEAKFFVGIDQISRVAGALLNEKDQPYANEADWRAFAYQAKLALWSFFPRYLGSQDK